MAPRHQHLITFERALLMMGSALALWCVLINAEAKYFGSLPLPSAHHARLPGEGPEETKPAVHVSKYSALQPGDWVARLDAPSVQLTATVLEGSDEATLALGAGHIEETAFPGEGGNIGIAGHRDTTFRAVRNLAVGDTLIVTSVERVQQFRITSTTIVNPEDVYVLDPTERPTLTLVTCYPFTYVGHAPRRFIVTAQLTTDRPR